MVQLDGTNPSPNPNPNQVQLDGSWSKGEVVRIVQRRGQAALSVSVEDGATRNYAQKDEGKTWRRVAPAIG